MPKVAVVTDSLACLTQELVEQYKITVVPLSFLLQGRVYRDWVDITPTKAYELFLKSPDSFDSSAPSPADFVEGFRKARELAASILCINISEKLSVTIGAARVAAPQVTGEIPGTTIEILDSHTTTAAAGMIVLAAARAAAAGGELPEVVKAAENVRDKVRLVALLDTIKHVYRSGRIPKVASQIGAMLHVKPILSITTESDGLVHFDGIERSHANGIRRLIKMMKEEVGQNPIRAAVVHAYAAEEAVKLKDLIAAEFNCVEIWTTEFSPLMGYAIGTGAVGVAFYREN